MSSKEDAYDRLDDTLTLIGAADRIRLPTTQESGNSSVVEHRLAKARVAGSNPVSRSNFSTTYTTSTRRKAYTTCSSENCYRFMGPLLSSRTAEVAIVLSL